jgi:hypothetical protein
MNTLLAAIKKDPGPIPELKPPQGAIPFDLPEHLIFGGLLAVAVLTLVIGRIVQLRRPRVLPPPELPIAIARRELAAVTNDAPLAACTGIVRRYVLAAFHLGPEGLTGEEVCAAYAGHPAADEDSLAALREFLIGSDLTRFAPISGEESAKDCVCRAFVVLELLEARRTAAQPPPLPVLA